MSLLQAVMLGANRERQGPTDPFKMTAGQRSGARNPLVQGLVNNLTNLTGGDSRSQEQQMKSALAEIDLSTTSGKEQAAKVYGDFGKTGESLSLLKQAEEEKIRASSKLKRQSFLTAAAKNLDKMGFKEDSELVASGALEIKEALDLVRQKTDIYTIGIAGLPGVEEALKQRNLQGAFSEEEKLIMARNPETFNSMLDNMKTDLKEFIEIVDGKERRIPLSVSSNGLVPSKEDPNKWVTPESRGLITAPGRSQITSLVSGAKAATDYIGGDKFDKVHQRALTAKEGLERTMLSEELLDKGTNTGLFGPEKTLLADLKVAIGIVEPESEEAQQAARSRILESNRLDNIAEYLDAFKPASNTDLAIVQRLKANPRWTKEAWKQLFAIERKWYERAIDDNNKSIKFAYGLADDKEEIEGRFDVWKVSKPTGEPVDQLSDDTLRFLRGVE